MQYLQSCDLHYASCSDFSICNTKSYGKKAISILKSGHEMVYSTCSVLEEENEKNIEKILKNQNIEIVPIDENLFEILIVPLPLQGASNKILSNEK